MISLICILIIGVFVWHLISANSISNSSLSIWKPTKIEFITSCIPNSLIRLENPTPDLYLLNIPIKIYNLHTVNGLTRVHFELIYFSLNKGEFSVGESTISYNLNELHEIFQDAIQGNKPTIYVNLVSRKLTIYPNGHSKIEEFNKLKRIYKELNSVEQDLEKLNKDLAKVESLMSTIQGSELYQYQVETYQKGLNLLKRSQMKAISVRDEYLKFLKEYTLNFCLEDIEATVF